MTAFLLKMVRWLRLDFRPPVKMVRVIISDKLEFVPVQASELRPYDIVQFEGEDTYIQLVEYPTPYWFRGEWFLRGVDVVIEKNQDEEEDCLCRS